MTTPSANELEDYIVSPSVVCPPRHPELYDKAPQEARSLFLEHSKEGIPTAVCFYDPTETYYVIQTAGQGPYIIWQEDKDK